LSATRQLGRLLEPFGGRLKSVDAIVWFSMSAAVPDQLRSQLSLAKLQEVPAADVASVPVNAGQAPVPLRRRFHKRLSFCANTALPLVNAFIATLHEANHPGSEGQ
jgi:hypothetical protein